MPVGEQGAATDSSPSTGSASSRPPVGRPWLGITLAGAAALIGAVATSPVVAVLSAVLTCGAAGVALHINRAARTEVGWLAWGLGPSGVMLAAIAAVSATYADALSWPALTGAAAAAMVGRSWLDERAKEPVRAVVAALSSRLPSTVRLPIEHEISPTEVTQREVETDSIRAGEEVLAVEGETVAVDGVVKAGEAWAYLYPSARSPVRREAGDALLAGARIAEGAVRILANRVGGDRAMARPAKFGDESARAGAPVTRFAARLARWGGVAALLGAGSALALAEGSGAGGPLSAAAAALIAAPLLSIRRAAELPLLAAAAIAADRGIVFHSARVLDTAGRVTVVALATRGTVTERKLDVVEVHTMDGAAPEPLIALAAAAEACADGHPIAKAILDFAEDRGVAPESVRRVTFVPGRGVTALAPGGEPLVIGNRQLLLDEGVSVAVADEEAARAEERGHRAIFFGLAGRVRAVISLQDAVRPGARAAVQRIFDLHVEVVLLSGDHRPTVEALARTLDVANVRAELLPEDRGTEVRRLRETGAVVAAIGLPADDDAALAAADVPIVLGAAGSATSERVVALATDDVRDAAAALWIAKAARAGAWRSVLGSTVAGTLVVAAAAIGVAVPAVAGLFGVAVDAFALPAGARLLRRIALRVPARS